MEEDNVLPNDGSYFLPREPAEQIIDRKKERAKTLEALSVLNEIIAHFDERIAFRDSLSSITVDISKDPLLFQKVFEVSRLLKQALEEEKSLLEEKIEVHANR